MGTSVNQRSPETTNWRLVQEIYQDPNIPVAQALRILWRAASNTSEANLTALLSRPEIGEMSGFAERFSSPAEASREITRYISEAKISSLATDIAKRAVMQCAGQPDARQLFIQRVFSEATSYLVSRDLPGYVGPNGRCKNVEEARSFTREMMKTTFETVSSISNAGAPNAQNSWGDTVTATVNRLRGRR